MMRILEHSAKGATIKLDRRELILLMELIQEGRVSFGCHTVFGKALGELFSSANSLVERARRRNLKQFVVWQKIQLVGTPALH